MTQHSRLILSRDGERAFAHLADSIARLLDDLLRKNRIKKKDLAEKAGVDQAVVSRVLDGSRNVEIRTAGALFGALGYVLEVKAKSIYGPSDNNQIAPKARSERMQGGEQTYDPNPSVRIDMRLVDA